MPISALSIYPYHQFLANLRRPRLGLKVLGILSKSGISSVGAWGIARNKGIREFGIQLFVRGDSLRRWSAMATTKLTELRDRLHCHPELAFNRGIVLQC